MEYSFLQSGENALTVQFKNEISQEVNGYVASLCCILKSKSVRGVTELLPTFCSLLIIYDSTVLPSTKLKRIIKRQIKSISESTKKQQKIYVIPVCYDDEFAPDIENVCAHSKLTKSDVIKIHSSKDYLIYMLGFLPGFAYLGGLDKRICTPRLDSPRTCIPSGSVGIGGEQTGIYPLASPGGWQLIGRTPVKIFDGRKTSPVLFGAGDYIRFESITKKEYYQIEQQISSDAYNQRILEVPNK